MSGIVFLSLLATALVPVAWLFVKAEARWSGPSQDRLDGYRRRMGGGS